MNIALDAMGGDFGAENNVKAAIMALKEFSHLDKVYLVGKKDQILRLLEHQTVDEKRIEIIDCDQEVSMKDAPSIALRQKKQSSLALMFQLHKDQAVNAVVSAGNTGAVMAFALKYLGRLPGINRPGIVATLPTRTGIPVVLMDVGANTDCKAKNLLQFGYMGSIFSENIIGIPRPKVGLINIGEESSKGNDISLLAHQLLEKSGLNFQGNAEGRDILGGNFHVIVMDGFVGNIVLKHSESLVYLVNSLFKEAIRKHFWPKIGALFMLPAFDYLKKKLNYESYGGGALLGINGNCIISHGKSSPLALKNAIREAISLNTHSINQLIEKEMLKHNSEDF